MSGDGVPDVGHGKETGGPEGVEGTDGYVDGVETWCQISPVKGGMLESY